MRRPLPAGSRCAILHDSKALRCRDDIGFVNDIPRKGPVHKALAFILVGAGGAAGSMTRYLLTLLTEKYSITFPLGTLGSNLAGCLIIGTIYQVSVDSDLLSPEMRLLFATGFCGGFTTMSSFIYEVLQFLRSGDHLHCALYFGFTLMGSVAAFFLGCFIPRIIYRVAGALWS